MSSKRKFCESNNNKRCCICTTQPPVPRKEYDVPAQLLGQDVAATTELPVAFSWELRKHASPLCRAPEKQYTRTLPLLGEPFSELPGLQSQMI